MYKTKGGFLGDIGIFEIIVGVKTEKGDDWPHIFVKECCDIKKKMWPSEREIKDALAAAKERSLCHEKRLK